MPVRGMGVRDLFSFQHNKSPSFSRTDYWFKLLLCVQVIFEPHIKILNYSDFIKGIIIKNKANIQHTNNENNFAQKS